MPTTFTKVWEQDRPSNSGICVEVPELTGSPSPDGFNTEMNPSLELVFSLSAVSYRRKMAVQHGGFCRRGPVPSVVLTTQWFLVSGGYTILKKKHYYQHSRTKFNFWPLILLNVLHWTFRTHTLNSTSILSPGCEDITVNITTLPCVMYSLTSSILIQFTHTWLRPSF